MPRATRSTDSTRRSAASRTSPRSPRKDAKDIFDVLKREHAEARRMFEEIEKSIEREESPSRELVHRLCEALEAHAFAEEAVLYPALESAEPTRDHTLEALVEHGAVKDLVAEVAHGDLGSDEWAAAFHVMHEYVNHHVKEEEGELFRGAKQVLDKDRRESLVAEFEEAKRHAPVAR